MAADVIVLGGRPFVAATEDTSTFDQDAWLMRLVMEHRLHEVVQQNGDIVHAVLATGRVTEFLAGVLTPADGEWTPAGATANAAMFAKLRAPAEKAALHAALTRIVVGFFEAGVGSSPSSPTASASPASETTPSESVPAAPSSPASPPSSSPHARIRRGRVVTTRGTPSSPPSGTTTASA